MRLVWSFVVVAFMAALGWIWGWADFTVVQAAILTAIVVITLVAVVAVSVWLVAVRQWARRFKEEQG